MACAESAFSGAEMSETPIRVVIVEDHTLVREGTHQILSQSPDIEVVGEAERGDEAVELIEKLAPDVVLLDMRLPGMNGIEVARAVTSKHKAIRVLLLSAYDDEDYVAEALNAGAAGYMLKTTPGAKLIEAVRAVHAGATVLQDELSQKLAMRVMHPGSSGPRLSGRELDVLRLTALGLSSKDIAGRLQISQRTVEGHLNNIYSKLGVNSRTEAVVHAAARGLISLESK
jgi:DNA-binding NarL/FixJ family response regulator